MNKVIFALLSLCVVASCSKEQNNNDDLSGDLTGVWVFDKINNEEITTNEYFAGAFIEGGIHEYLQWLSLDADHSTLVYKDSSSWSLDGSQLTIENEKLDDHIVLDITINGDAINWVEKEKIVGGNDYYKGDTYQGYRVKTDYTSTICEGVWEGRATKGRDVNPYLRIKYNADSTYDFQYRQSEDESWSDKVDNDGHYYLIGDLLGSVWTNDINSGTEGSNSETWIISIEKDTMTWQATREDNHTESFSFTRVE